MTKPLPTKSEFEQLREKDAQLLEKINALKLEDERLQAARGEVLGVLIDLSNQRSECLKLIDQLTVGKMHTT